LCHSACLFVTCIVVTCETRFLSGEVFVVINLLTLIFFFIIFQLFVFSNSLCVSSFTVTDYVVVLQLQSLETVHIEM